MSGPRHYETFPRYPEHADSARRALFAKDREIRKLSQRADTAEDALGFIAEVLSGRIGGTDDKAWMVATIEETLRAKGYL
jgi:hypothetical protein